MSDCYVGSTDIVFKIVQCVFVNTTYFSVNSLHVRYFYGKNAQCTNSLE